MTVGRPRANHVTAERIGRVGELLQAGQVVPAVELGAVEEACRRIIDRGGPRNGTKPLARLVLGLIDRWKSAKPP